MKTKNMSLMEKLELQKVLQPSDPRENATVTTRLYEEWNQKLEVLAAHYGFKKGKLVRHILIDFIDEACVKLGYTETSGGPLLPTGPVEEMKEEDK